MRFFCAPRRGGERRARGAADARRRCFSTPSLRVRLSLASFDGGLPIFSPRQSFHFRYERKIKALPPRGAVKNELTIKEREREREEKNDARATEQKCVPPRLCVCACARVCSCMYLAREFFLTRSFFFEKRGDEKRSLSPRFFFFFFFQTPDF